jgi:large subunit ribosomal protein L15
MQFHQLKPRIKQKTKKRIGRGGKRGTYSGRGIKGQRARSGHKIRPQLRDILKKLPKRRGYRVERFPRNVAVVNLSALEKNFDDKTIVSPKILAEKGLVRKVSGKMPAVKILGGVTLSKVFTIQDCLISKKAENAVKKAGGRVEVRK